MAGGEASEQRDRLEAAAAWRVRLAESRQETSPAFEAWLAADPRNRAAWGEADALWTALGDHAGSPEFLGARSAALARARQAAQGQRGWSRPAAAAAAVLLLLGGLAALQGWRGLRPASFSTAHGERRTVMLADGSAVTLDSDSLVRVSYSHAARRLELARGQARFDVAHDVARPFEVTAGDRTVVATGTSFEVERRGPAVRVVLLQGRVKVYSVKRFVAGGPGGLRPTPLAPGQALLAETPASPDRVQAADLERATAWESGKLIFDDERLDAVAAAVSRYTNVPVTVRDPEAASLRLSGVFRTGDLRTFVDAVTRYLPVEAVQAQNEVELRSRQAAAARTRFP